jgi:hypothetical protein
VPPLPAHYPLVGVCPGPFAAIALDRSTGGCWHGQPGLTPVRRATRHQLCHRHPPPPVTQPRSSQQAPRTAGSSTDQGTPPRRRRSEVKVRARPGDRLPAISPARRATLNDGLAIFCVRCPFSGIVMPSTVARILAVPSGRRASDQGNCSNFLHSWPSALRRPPTSRVARTTG